jgi:methyl-accepting chemotaxis protein
MDANLSSVANASEKAATNVQTVAMAAEEMSATIKGIAANTEKGSMITRQAVKQAQSVTEKVSELGRATKDVGNITTTEEIASIC